MRVYIARHGEASFDADSDFSRPLTERGLLQTRQLIKENLACFQNVQHIWASPLLRAQQTASCYHEMLHLDVQTKPFITPDSSSTQVIRQLEKANLTELLLVSHQPLVGELVSVLCEGDAFHAHPYATSEVLVLDTDMYAPGLATVVRRMYPR